MQSGATIGRIGGRPHDDDPNILTPADKYNQNHSGAKLTRQIKALKDNFGMGSILGTLSLVVSIIVAVIVIGTPVYKQGEATGMTAEAVKRIEQRQQDNKDEQNRALNDAVSRIEAGIKQAVDLAQQNREDLRAMSERMERRVDKVETMSQSNWNWMVELKNKVGSLESEIKRPK